jgi:CRP-like cAMP-binding protein
VPDDDASDIVQRELELRSEIPFAQSEAQLHQLLSIARNVEFQSGDHLFERGAPISNVYVVTSGDIEMVADGMPSWRFSGSGAIGFIDMILNRPYARTAIARSEVRTLEINADDYREYMQDSEVGSDMLSRLAADLLGAVLGSLDPARLLHRPAEPSATAPPATATLVDRLLLLSRVPALSLASVQSLANLAQNAQVVHAAAGDTLALAGAHVDTLSILVHGEVELIVPHLGIRATRGPVDLMCDIAELSTAPRAVTVRARRDSVILEIDREELLDRFDEHFELVQSLLAYIGGQRERFNDMLAAIGRGI